MHQKNTKLYTIGWIGFATYIGGPLAGTYLMSKNFKNLNKKNYAQNTLIIGIIITILLFGAVPFIPESIINQIPNSIIPTTYTGIIYGFLTKYQKEDIKKHIKNNGAKESGWKAAGIAILSIIISLAYFFTLVLLLPERLIS